MKMVANAGSFVVLYLLFMLPTYFLPFLGSNSALVGSIAVATGVGVNPAFWLHLGCFFALVMIGWTRGSYIQQQWLVIFPVLAGIFDLFPGINSIPLIPTVLHVLMMVVGVILSKNPANDPQHQPLEINKPANEPMPQPQIITPLPQNISPSISAPSVQHVSQQRNAPQKEEALFLRFLGNGFVFFVLYVLCMLPSYFLPFFGSNSALLGGLTLASGAGINPATIIHAGSLGLLIVITWIRGTYSDRGWLIIFPVLGSVFDLFPGLNNIPLIPTLMHLLAVIIGVIPAQRKHIKDSASALLSEPIEVAQDQAGVDGPKQIQLELETFDPLPDLPGGHAPDIPQAGKEVIGGNNHRQHYFIPLATGFAVVGSLIFGVYYYFNPDSKIGSLPAVFVSKTKSSTHSTAFTGVWKYTRDNMNRYLRIQENAAGLLVFHEGWQQIGRSDINWIEPSLDNEKEIYLSDHGGKLAAQFDSTNFRATHAMQVTYKVELSLEAKDKIRYTTQMLRDASKNLWTTEDDVIAIRQENSNITVSAPNIRKDDDYESQAKVIAMDSLKPLFTICNGNAFIKEGNSVWELKGNIEAYGCHEPPANYIAQLGQNSWSCGIEIAAPSMRLYSQGQGWSNWNAGMPLLLGVTQRNNKWDVNTSGLARVNCQDIDAINRANTGKTLVGRVNAPGDGFLALRSEPSVKLGYRMLKIPHGTQLVLGDCVSDTSDDKWCKTEYGGKNGWVIDRYLTLMNADSSDSRQKEWRASFDCALAKKTAEVTICQTNVLGQFDKEMAEIYSTHLESYARDQVIIKKLCDSQKKWLADRNRCGSDVSCLRSRYQERIGFLHEFEGHY